MVPAGGPRPGTTSRDRPVRARDDRAGSTAYDPGMSPGIVLLVLVACLVAMLPVWRLRLAGWPARWLFAAWLVYAIGIILVVRFAGGFRFLLPILVLAYVAPFVAGPERLARVLRGRRPEEPVGHRRHPEAGAGAARACGRRADDADGDDALTGDDGVARDGGPADRAGRPARRRGVRRGRRAGDGRPGRGRGGGARRSRRRRVRSGWCWCRPPPHVTGRTSPRRTGRRAFEAAGARAGLAVEVGGRGRAGRSLRGGPRERGAPRGGSPDPSPGRRPGPAARRAARDARLGRHPPGTRRRGVRRGCERRGDGARRAALDRDGPVDGLGLVPGIAVLPHFDPRRAAAWRSVVDPDGRLAWLGLDERTLVIGRPGGTWTVAGRGGPTSIDPGSASPARSAVAGEVLALP